MFTTLPSSVGIEARRGFELAVEGGNVVIRELFIILGIPTDITEDLLEEGEGVTRFYSAFVRCRAITDPAGP